MCVCVWASVLSLSTQNTVARGAIEGTHVLCLCLFFLYFLQMVTVVQFFNQTTVSFFPFVCSVTEMSEGEIIYLSMTVPCQ